MKYTANHCENCGRWSSHIQQGRCRQCRPMARRLTDSELKERRLNEIGIHRQTLAQHIFNTTEATNG